MGIEIERKFLPKPGHYDWRKNFTKRETMVQGYLSLDKKRIVRVRVEGKVGFLTIKSTSKGFSRPEYEYPIPLQDAKEMIELSLGEVIEKTRYYVPFEGLTFEVDEFAGKYKGLVTIEVELKSEDQEVSFPNWVGKEVTNDKRYFNSNMAK